MSIMLSHKIKQKIIIKLEWSIDWRYFRYMRLTSLFGSPREKNREKKWCTCVSNRITNKPFKKIIKVPDPMITFYKVSIVQVFYFLIYNSKG